MPRRRVKTLERQKQTLDAAMRIITEEGIERLTIARLAKDIGASVGGLYRYFPSKEAVLFELQKEAIEALGDYQRAWIEGAASGCSAPEPQVHVLCTLVASFWAYPAYRRREPERHALMTALLGSRRIVMSDALAHEAQMLITPILERCVRQLDDAKSCGAIVDGDLTAAYTLWAALHGLDAFRKRDRIQPEALRVDALLAPLLRTFLVGWGAVEAYAEQAIAHVQRCPEPFS